MGQLLVMLIVPPVVGVATYLIIRRIWERGEYGAGEVVERRDPLRDAGGRNEHRPWQHVITRTAPADRSFH